MVYLTKAKGAYLVLGFADLAIATLITLGIGFSSSALASKMALFVDLPLGIGVIASFTKNRFMPVFTVLGTISTLIYIAWFNYGSFKNGFTPLPFHVIWALLSIVLASLAVFIMTRPPLQEE